MNSPSAHEARSARAGREKGTGTSGVVSPGEDLHVNQRPVVLVIPNSRWFEKRAWLLLPHAALLLTAMLKHDFDFRIVDANAGNLTEEETRVRLAAIRPSVVLVSCLTVEYHQQYHRVLALARDAVPETLTVLGGIYPTVLGEQALRDANLDYIFVGHAEERAAPFVRLARDRDHERLRRLPGVGFRTPAGAPVINPVPGYIGSVKRLAKPDYSLIDVQAYMGHLSRDYQTNSQRRAAPLITAYGCPYNCLFCATRTISGRGIAYRPAEEVLEEIDFLVSRHGVEELIFLDDSLLGDRRRIVRILEGLVERRYPLTWKTMNLAAWHLDDELLELMRRSGCHQITVSVESGSQRVLREIIRKPLKLGIVPPLVQTCRALGIDIGANFVIGFPGESWDEIRETFRFAETCNFDIVHFHIATPLPKTDLYLLVKERWLLPPDFSFTDPRFFGYGRAFIGTDEWTPEELMTLRAYEWDRINFSTPEKTAKIAGMMQLAPEELAEHRRQTRRKIGLHFAEA